MASYIKRGESLFIPFMAGKSISDSQCKPRMYKSKQNFEKTFPKHNYVTSGIELVEYDEVKHSRWEKISGFDVCNICGTSPAYCEPKPNNPKGYPPYCHFCGAKMDGGKNNG